MKRRATNAAAMKDNNQRLILNLIRRQPVSRAELARITGLTRAAVSMQVDQLLLLGALREAGTTTADFGRKPTLLTLNPDYFYTVGVAIARDTCHIGLVDFQGKPLDRRSVDLTGCGAAEACLQVLAAAVRGMIQAAAVPAAKILGIGINMPGPVDIIAGTVLDPPNFRIWHHVPVARFFADCFLTSAFLENNATALALAEKNYGRGADLRSFLLLAVDTGIGAGIIMDGRLYRGRNGFGCEIGHTTIDWQGLPCSCGNTGCLEVYASVPAVLERLRQQGVTADNWPTVVDLACDGQPAARAALAAEAHYLAAGLINAMNILELEAVILTGDINYRPEMLAQEIQGLARQTAITRNIHTWQVLSSTIGPEHDIIAAAAIVLERFFTGDLTAV